MDEVGKEHGEIAPVEPIEPTPNMTPGGPEEQAWLENRLREMRGEEPLTPAQEEAREKRLRQGAAVRRALGGKVVALAAPAALVTGLAAGCAVKEALKRPTQTLVAQKIEYTKPTAEPSPTVERNVFRDRPPMVFLGDFGDLKALNSVAELQSAKMARLAEAEQQRAERTADVRGVEDRINSEAFKSAEVAEVSPRKLTPFFNPQEAAIEAFGKETAYLIFPEGADGQREGYIVSKTGGIAPISAGKMEYQVCPGGSFEVLTQGVNKDKLDYRALRAKAGMMGSAEEPGAGKIEEAFQIDTGVDALGRVAGVRLAKRLPDGTFAKDGKDNYIFEGPQEMAWVLFASSPDGKEPTIIIMRGDLHPVMGKLGDKFGTRVDLSTRTIDIIDKETGEETGVTYNPLTGEWEGDKDKVLEKVPNLAEILDLEGFTKVLNNQTGRVEYIDSDGQATAYWNEETKKVELVKGVTTIDLEKHRGLIVDWSAEDAYQEYLVTGKIPITIITPDGKGIIGEGRSLKELVGFAGISEGSSVYALFDGEISSFATSKGSTGFLLSSKQLNFTIRYFCDYQSTLPNRVTRGSRIAILGSRLVGGFSDPLLGKSEAIIGTGDGEYNEAYDLDFGDFMRDSLGRFVRIGGAPSK